MKPTVKFERDVDVVTEDRELTDSVGETTEVEFRDKFVEIIADEDQEFAVSEERERDEEDDIPTWSDRQTDLLIALSDCDTIQPALGPILRKEEIVLEQVNLNGKTNHGDFLLYSAHSASGCDSKATLPSESQEDSTVYISHTRGRNLFDTSSEEIEAGERGEIYTQSVHPAVQPVQTVVQTGSVQCRREKQSEIGGGGQT